MSSWPSSSENAGMIIGIRNATDTRLMITGWRRTTPDQRCHIPLPGWCGGEMNFGNDAHRMRCLIKPRNDGSREIEPSTAMMTPIADASPRDVTKGIWATAKDSNAITTVPPAKTIELPEVATAFAMESCIGMPSRSCS